MKKSYKIPFGKKLNGPLKKSLKTQAQLWFNTVPSQEMNEPSNSAQSGFVAPVQALSSYDEW
jgi:hypothetical protein